MQQIRVSVPAQAVAKRIYFIADFPPPVNGNNIVTHSLYRFFDTQQGIVLKKIDTSMNAQKFFKTRRMIKFIKTGFRVLLLPRRSVIYLGLAHRLALVGQSLIIIAGHIRGCKVVVHHHSYFPIYQRGKLPIYVHLIHKYIIHQSINIFLSEKMRIDYSEKWGIPISSFNLSNSFVPAIRFGKSMACVETQIFTMIHVSNLSKEKGSKLVLDVMEYFLSQNTKFNAILMGADFNYQFSKRILNLETRFPSQFSYQATFDSDQLHQSLIKSDVLLFPSTYENESSPLVVHEAQYCGVICVASAIGTLTSEVLKPGVASRDLLLFSNLTSKIEELASFKFASPEEYYLSREDMRQSAIKRGKSSVIEASFFFLDLLK